MEREKEKKERDIYIDAERDRNRYNFLDEKGMTEDGIHPYIISYR